ncbi:MAG: trimeric intracellular cation channel family protein [Clostridiales bacterium]|nr:trimeric intracellular cation channel family protein [Candidatus Blautia equi]
MNWTFLEYFDLVGTIAFAISGAFVGIRKKMDIFGVVVLAITTACGGGLIRDLIIGNNPPRMFRDPFYVMVAAVIGIIVFAVMYKHGTMPAKIHAIYDQMLFWFDTLGLAAFTVDGVMIGVGAGYGPNKFLIVFLGFMTGVGGGALRDIMADQMPDIFVKHIYALASIAGGITMTFIFGLLHSWQPAMIGGFITVILVRFLAARYNWNLPKVRDVKTRSENKK